MAVEIAAIRIVNGRQVPPVGRWSIDPSHSQVEFQVRHLMIAKVRGRFRVFSGTIDVAVLPENSAVEVSIDAASIDTGDAQRDAHLRSAEFLDVEHHPTITYRSTGVRPGEGDSWMLDGDLTIRGVSHPVVLEIEFSGAVSDPWGKLRTAFNATGEMDRDDWGINWNQALESGGFLVGKRVKVNLEVEAILQSDELIV
jgi:polyisoprenoid-binding protein YceI